MLYRRLLDKNSYRCEPLTDLSYPVVLLQGSQSSSDGFIERLRSDLYGVLNVLDILYCDCAGSEDHKQSVAYSSFVRYTTRLLGQTQACNNGPGRFPAIGPRKRGFRRNLQLCEILVPPLRGRVS